VGALRGDPHRQQDMARLGGAAGACAAGAALHPVEVEGCHQVASLNGVDQPAGAVRQPFDRMAAGLDSGKVAHRGQEAISQAGEPRILGVASGRVALGQLQRPREADDAGHVLGSRAPLPLLRATLDLR
jgi:hypothetical protein